MLVLFGWYFCDRSGPAEAPARINADRSCWSRSASSRSGRRRKRSRSASTFKAAPLFSSGSWAATRRSIKACSTRQSRSFASGSITLARANRSSVRSGTIEFSSKFPGSTPQRFRKRAINSHVSQSSSFVWFIPITANGCARSMPGKEVIPPDYRIEVYKHQPPKEMKNRLEERLLVKRKPISAATEFQHRTLTTATRAGPCS